MDDEDLRLLFNNPTADPLPGITGTERILAEFCERSFLKLWSYPSPFKDDSKQLCDLLAAFGDHIFIFFDRERRLPTVPDIDPQVLWDRWKRSVIDRQVNTAHGAERYIRSGRPIFLDAKGQQPFLLDINPQTANFHKIIVAHGAKDACKQASEQNVYGSLSIDYLVNDGGPTRPFHIEIDKRNPIHIFDSHNFSILLGELDTVTDLTDYFDEKLRAIQKFDSLMYCGEEDLLGHYYVNYDEQSKKHVIGPKRDEFNSVMIGEGEWHDFIRTDLYSNTKKENQVSYIWDHLIQKTCRNYLNRTLGGNSDIPKGKSAIYEMVKEPRLARRMLANRIKQAIVNFPDDAGPFCRQVTFMQSYFPKVGYVFLQLKVPDDYRSKDVYLEIRRGMLELACGVAKNKFMELTKVIGIAIDAPKFAGETNSEDFILLPCDNWPDEMREHYEEGNRAIGIFATPGLELKHERVTQFVPPSPEPSTRSKVGRNSPCPCGSGKKFKKCHGQ